LKIPEKGADKKEIFRRLEEFRRNDVDWRTGRIFGYVFDPGEKAMEVSKEAYMAFLTENALDFTVFPSLLRLENALVAMSAAHVGGDDQVVGNFTSGGTESIILAVKACRDYFRAKRPKIKEPEMVLPTTGHSAFHKAAHYLDVNVVAVPVRSEDFRADALRMKQAVTPNTIMMVGSAPSYAHGVVDPIQDLGQIALDHHLWFHVDACVGGFMLPYFKRLGTPVPDFDFSVPGVSSLSMDLHKYAYTPKGASIVLYRSKELRKHQIFACASWTGYTVVNNAVQSSKSGGPMAAAWAALNFIGDDGYLEIARRKLDATKRLAQGIEQIKGLRLMARPDMCMLSFTSDTINVFHIIDEMNARGWYIQPQLAFDNSHENVHMSISAANLEWTESFLEDLKVCTEKAGTMQSGELAAVAKEAFAGIDPDELTEETITQMLGMAGIEGTGLPERMAEINAILNSLPGKLRERLLIEYVNELFRYHE
jgi:glutamate/tyrosine decarboxylase-like PLP-dependent enzyme